MGLMNCVVQDICLLRLEENGTPAPLFFVTYVRAAASHCEWRHSKGHCVMLFCVYVPVYVYVILTDNQFCFWPS